MLVRGENVIVAEYNAMVDAWVLWGCARTCSLAITRQFIETSVSGAGNFETIEPTKISFTGSMEGLVNLDEVNLLSLGDITTRILAGTKLLMRFQRTAGASTLVSQAYFYISEVSDEGPMEQMNSFSVTLKGTGALTQTYTPTEILGNVKRFQYTGIAGELSFSNVTDAAGGIISLTGKTVLGLEVDGIGFSKQLTSGTPVDKQFKFVQGTGVLTVPYPMDAGIEAFGYYR